jgi:peptidyl-prolyl cis-trans isomerase B (cyclophilin B)
MEVEMKFKSLILFLGFGIWITGCTKKGNDCTPLSQEEMDAIIEKANNMPLEPVQGNEHVVFQTNYGKMVVDLFQDKAPEHAKSFKRLVKSGYYDCTKFHRVIKDFMVQGGDIATRDENPKNDGGGPGPGYTLKAEFNDIPHDKGILSMARSADPNSAGSQFFICLTRERTKHLDGQYTVFGKVVQGIDVLEKIGNVKTVTSPVYGQPVLPAEPVIIEDAYMTTKQ